MVVMDPQSAIFTPQDEVWRIHSEMLRVQQTQAEHAERLARLERRQDEDARVRSVWGPSSPFPGVLSGTPQQGPLHQPSVDAFSSFDEQPTNMIGSLHLDPEEEPRRTGATSRANSVRFDESANHGHWAQASRSSLDLIPRTGSGLGGHALTERSFSHKSDGRQSSAGHSVHSATSGRANSLGLDAGFGIGHSHDSSADPPGLAPGLFILGSVPAIIRCWLNTNFKNDSLLYAAVCCGSYASFLDAGLVERLRFTNQVYEADDGTRKIKLTVYLPEAILHPTSSRSDSPPPQLPSIAVDFTVVDSDASADNPKAIQVFLGSDVLRLHNADILFSSNKIILFDDDRSKLSIPLVRPEDDRSFKTLRITNLATGNEANGGPEESSQPIPPVDTSPSDATKTTGSRLRELGILALGESGTPTAAMAADLSAGESQPIASHADSSAVASRTPEQKPFLDTSNTKTGSKDTKDPTLAATRAASQTGHSPSIWSNWRQQGERASSMEWASASKNSSQSYQRKDQGIKILKPSKSSSRTTSTPQSATLSSASGQSRFFDEGRRRTSVSSGHDLGDQGVKSASPGDERGPNAASKENQPLSTKPRSLNPLGGASAFPWLNQSK